MAIAHAFAIVSAAVATSCSGVLLSSVCWLRKLLKISILGLGWELAGVWGLRVECNWDCSCLRSSGCKATECVHRVLT